MRNFQATHESSFSVFDQTFNGDSNTKCTPGPSVNNAKFYKEIQKCQ